MAERKAKWQNDYIAKAYDRINLLVPKGYKDKIKAHADSRGESVNGFINRVIIKAIEDEFDLQAYDKALANFHADPVTYSLDEVETELAVSHHVEFTKAAKTPDSSVKD